MMRLRGWVANTELVVVRAGLGKHTIYMEDNMQTYMMVRSDTRDVRARPRRTS